MELLKSTNPLARRVTEFSQPDPDSTVTNPAKSIQDWMNGSLLFFVLDANSEGLSSGVLYKEKE